MDTFSIGINTRPKTKLKRPKKIKANGNMVYSSEPNNQFDIEVFDRYDGPRWKIPALTYITNSISGKFATLETYYSLRSIKRIIEWRIKSMKFNFDACSLKTASEKWKAPQWLTSMITSYYAKEENDWIKVRGIYFSLFNFRNKIKPFIFNLRIKKCLENVKNTDDPVTMEPPKKPIRVIDFENKISFIYEASTIRKTIENKILLSDYMFPEPQEPLNLLTNVPFSYKQLISIIQQCKNYSEFNWILEDLYKYNCDLELFTIYNKQRLKIEAINTYFKKSSYFIRETTMDFFGLEADDCELSIDTAQRFANLYDTKPESRMVMVWIRLTREYYIAKELQDVSMIKRNSREVSDFMDKIYRFFL
jgi:hypothetical protein